MCLNRLAIRRRVPIPMDVINEIKYFCFHDKVSGESNKIKKRSVSILKTAMSREAGTTGQDITYYINNRFALHWAFGFINNETESLQLQAVNCVHCGNYHMFNDMDMDDRSLSTLDKLMCNCGHVDEFPETLFSLGTP
jgi:hypothetical protein